MGGSILVLTKEKGATEVIFQSNISIKKIATTVKATHLSSEFQKLYLSINFLKSVPVQIKVLIICLYKLIC